jgi:hypothetical protein
VRGADISGLDGVGDTGGYKLCRCPCAATVGVVVHTTWNAATACELKTESGYVVKGTGDSWPEVPHRFAEIWSLFLRSRAGEAWRGNEASVIHVSGTCTGLRWRFDLTASSRQPSGKIVEIGDKQVQSSICFALAGSFPTRSNDEFGRSHGPLNMPRCSL